MLGRRSATTRCHGRRRARAPGGDADAWAVIEAHLRYAAEGLHIVLISRRSLPARAAGSRCPPAVPRRRSPSPSRRPPRRSPRAATSTGGGRRGDRRLGYRRAVRGVALARARGGRRRRGRPAVRLPVRHILDQLRRGHEFLIATSLLDEVTAARAAALGPATPPPGSRAAGRPPARAGVTTGGAALPPALSRVPAGAARAARRRGGRGQAARHARLLADEGHHEEAVEELLAPARPRRRGRSPSGRSSA